MREQYGESLTVVSDDTVLRYAPSIGAVREARQPTERYATTWIWAPRALAALLDFDAKIVEVERLGLPAWRVTASRTDQPFAMVGAGLSVEGERYQFDVDQATGVVLQLTGSLRSGEPVGEIEWTSFAAETPIDPAVFDPPFPPGVTVQTRNEMLINVAQQRGIDTTGVDPNDDAEVQALLMRRPGPMRSLENHVPTGDPPADEADARAAIHHAFDAVAERDGDDLVNVQAGAGLAPYLDRAMERFNASLVVTSIKFLNATEAAVAYDVVGPHGQVILSRYDGRALFLHRAWRIERNAFTSLLELAGVHCPPASESGPNTAS